MNDEMEEFRAKRLTIVEEELSSAKQKIQRQIDEEFILAERNILTRIAEIDNNGSHESAFKQLKLQFTSKISPMIVTGEDIKGEGDTLMQVALVDIATGNIVGIGPEASAVIEIVLFHREPQGGDWTAKEFDENIFQDKEGKNPLLVKNTHVKLQKGIGVMTGIKLIHRAYEMKPPVFHLGARVVGAVYRGRIKEAKTEPFTVQTYRKKYYNKRGIPSLKDEVYRLANIGSKGPIRDRLRENGIETVEDFLIRYLRDPQGLKCIVNMPPKKWGDTLANARACRDKKMYCYVDHQQKAVIVFNYLEEVLELYFYDQTAIADVHKAEAQELLLASAYEHWEDVRHFDDENSLWEYSAAVRKSWDPLELQMPDFPAWGDLYGPGEISVDNYGLNPDTILWHFDDSCEFAGGPVHKTNAADEHRAPSAGFVKSQDVRNRHWKLFYRIWRWSVVIKKKISRKCHNPKKHKVH